MVAIGVPAQPVDATQGATTVVVNSTELCRSIRNANHSRQACCEAMEGEKNQAML
jgi:hypothetical protein